MDFETDFTDRINTSLQRTAAQLERDFQRSLNNIRDEQTDIFEKAAKNLANQLLNNVVLPELQKALQNSLGNSFGSAINNNITSGAADIFGNLFGGTNNARSSIQKSPRQL